MEIGENYRGTPFLNNPPLVVETRVTERNGAPRITMTEMTKERRRTVAAWDYAVDGGKRQEIGALNQRYYWHTPELVGYTARGGHLWLMHDFDDSEVTE